VTDRENLREIFKSYNLHLQKKFEESMHTVRTPGDYVKLMDDARNGWEQSNFNGKKPVELFADLTPTELISAFHDAACICDEFIPESLAEVIIKKCDISDFIELALSETEIDVKISAIRLMGMSGNANCAGILIELLHAEGEYADLISEKTRSALVEMGDLSLPYILEKVKSMQTLEADDFHLLIALVEIDKGSRSDDIFHMLKDGFRKSDDKALAARCLSDFGDGRAVTMLRSYLAANMDSLDDDTMHEIQGAILNLGGSLEAL